MTSDQRAAGPRAPSAWNLPNYLTVFRFALVPVFGWLLLADGGHVWGYRLAALAVFGVAMVTDSIDGDLARRRKQVTDFGKVADPIADKAMLGMALIGLSVIGIVPWWVTVVILVREVGVTVMRFVVIRHGVMPAGRGGKLKTALQTVAVGALIFPLESLPGGPIWLTAAYIVLAAALFVTVATGVDYLIKARRRAPPARGRRRGRRLAGRLGTGRSDGPSADIVIRLVELAQTVGSAESLTGGLVVATLVDPPGRPPSSAAEWWRMRRRSSPACWASTRSCWPSAVRSTARWRGSWP